MPGKIELIISADAANAIKTVKATQAQINNLAKQLPKLEAEFSKTRDSADLDKVNKQMSEILSLIDRAASAINQSNPAISEAQAKYDMLTKVIESLGREYKGLSTESLNYLKRLQSEIRATDERERKESEYLKSVNESLNKAKEMVEAQNSIATATKAAGTAAKTSSNYFRKLFDTTKNVLQFRVIMNVINSIASLKNLLKDASQAAAEAEQKFSKLNTVFGKTSNAMSKAISLASQLGVATSTAASALSTVGDLLQAQGQSSVESLSMAYEWISQFQDIIAFKDINMSLEEFAQNFMSGAAGNLRNFRTFGSIVRESAVNAELAKKGLDKLTGSELELAKMTTRAEMALEQQKNAIGATQREWDTMLSVQRRYEEAMTKFQENLGNSLNPVIKMWMQLKTVMLEVFTAQQTWNEKQKMVEEKKAIDTKYATFGKDGEIVNQSNYLGFQGAIRSANIDYASSFNLGEQQQALKDLMIAVQEYGATAVELQDTMIKMKDGRDILAEDFMQDAVTYATDYLLKLQDIKKEEEDINDLLSKANQADSFLEQIQTIRGVDLTNASFYNAFIKALDDANANGISNREGFEKKISNALLLGLNDAVNDIRNMNLSMTEKTFSSDPYLELLEKRRDAYKELYEMTANSGKFEAEQIDYIAKKWEKANESVEKYIEKKDLLSSLSSGTADYTKQLEQLGMSEFEKTINDFDRMLKGVTDPEIVDAINNQKEAFIALTEATEKEKLQQQWEDSFGEFGTLMSSFGSGGMPDLLSTLIQIVAQTEAFTRLSTILTDSILPVLNAFLEPLLPVIDQISSVISNLVETVLVPFYPILKAISYALAGLFGLIETVFATIDATFKKFIGTIVKWVEDAINSIIKWFGGSKVNFGVSDWANIDPQKVWEEKLDKTVDTLEGILNYSMEIANNTSDKDFDTYAKLLAAKEIDEATYNRWTGMDKYTTQNLANGVSYAQGNKNSYVNVNNLTVMAPSGMTLVEFLKGIEEYDSGHGSYAVNTMAV